MIPLAAVPYIAGGLGSLFGIGQKLQAAKLDRNNPFQARTVNSLIANNAAQAQNQAQIGIAQQQYNNARNQQAQNLATVLGTASRTGRNIPLAGLLRQGNLSTQQLNATDAQARQQNQRYAAQQNQVLAQEQQNVRSYNIEQPYLRRQQQAAELRNAGNQNIFGGLGTIASAAMMTAGDEQQGQRGNATGIFGNRRERITNFLPNQTVGNDLAELPYNSNTRFSIPSFFPMMNNYGRQNYGLMGRLG